MVGAFLRADCLIPLNARAIELIGGLEGLLGAGFVADISETRRCKNHAGFFPIVKQLCLIGKASCRRRHFKIKRFSRFRM